MIWKDQIVEIVDERTHQVLAYIEALNRHGARPSEYLVNQFAKSPVQRFKRVGGLTALSASTNIAVMLGERTVDDETFTEFLARVGWTDARGEGGVELSSIGRALLKALNTPAMEETATDVFEVVLNPDNPFAYAQAWSGMSSVKQALLVEPYFRLEQLMDLADFDNVTRVLVGSRLKPREYEVLATGLAALPNDRTLEIRKATDLHDRYLIPSREGNVLMLGASLGGIGKKVSTITTLGDVASQALRDAHESIWKAAELIEPKKTATSETPFGATETA